VPTPLGDGLVRLPRSRHRPHRLPTRSRDPHR
jgi:hypothetical protein